MRDFQSVQLRVGAAAAKIDAVRLLLRNDCLEGHNTFRDNGTLKMETKLRYKRNCAMGMKILGEAVDSLFEMLGGNGIYDSSVMQRIYRDHHAAAGHFSFSSDAQLGPWANVSLGGDFTSPTL